MREYLDRFNIVAMQIQNFDPAMELHSIKRGLRVGLFADSLAINLPRSLTKFREQAMGYVNMEEVQEMRKGEARMENGKAEDSKQSRK